MGVSSSTPASPARSNAQPPIIPGASNGTVPTQNGGIDALTSGMKKVTLKVGTKEEHDKKQKEKLDAERRARALKGAETRRVNAAARKAAAATKDTTNAPSPLKPTADRQVGQANTATTTPVTPQATQNGLSDQVQAWPTGPAPSQQAPNMLPTSVELAIDGGPDMPDYANAGFAPQEPDALPPTNPWSAELNLHALSSHESAAPPPTRESALSFQQPFSSPAAPPPQGPDFAPAQVPDSAARQLLQENHFANGSMLSPIQQALSPLGAVGGGAGGEKLPVWSSTGPIPFAPTGGVGQQQKLQQPGANGDGLDVKSEVKAEAGAEGSVWDVPVTPQKH